MQFNNCTQIYVGTDLLCFYFYPLCYAAVLLKFTYYAQYYAQEQELYAIHTQFCMNNSLHVAETVLLECIKEWYQSRLYYALTYDDCSIRVD